MSYFDSEGHVINYAATFSEDKRTLTLFKRRRTGHPSFSIVLHENRG